jgi:hypothetical protein
MHMHTILKIAVASVSLALMAGCSKDEGKTVVSKAPPPPAAPAPVAAAQPPAPAPVAPAPVAPAPTASAPVAPAAPSPAPTPVLASGEYTNDSQLRADLLEVKRVSGGSLTVRWRVTNTAAQSQGMVATEPKKISYRYHYNQLYYTDPAENKKYQYLSDSQGHQLLQIYEGEYAPGQQRGNWAKFPAPPATSKKITVHVPNFPPFEDVPVAD